MTNSNIQLIECVTIANEDYLQSLLSVGYYALALEASLLSLTKDLDFSNTQTKILLLDDELPAIEKQGITISSLATAYQAGTTRFYSAIKGYGGYLPTEKLLTFFQAQHLPTGMNLLAFESAYNEALHQVTSNK
ncbi:pyruvate carboxyltransferase [Capnocytophaga sp. 051621]|uniref:Pyruvate carboxyltransferase n=2 Tax=Capnocytophaga TaxID=1016 RepID=A0ABS1YTG4_9FLAO|nr:MULTISPECIES: pyruvate carboxyltransferase [Capnocytophaga]MBI1646481.1 pyruvate carboxyltransferase [Capnocytophaga periodontitidis]MBM0649383.1 pyruvate carboxyltransferase [Capnocytophaga genosp. AHN8471]MBM0661271.1 pyruvate carboxyltransferase [Capnocytophaga genosp. AHN8471]